MGRLRDYVVNRLGLEPAPALGRDIVHRDVLAQRHVEWLEGSGTMMSLYHTAIPAFWDSTYGQHYHGSPELAQKVWVANRCIQLNAQQIGSMPLLWHGPPAAQAAEAAGEKPTQPAWVSNPDPANYPNGISDAVFAAVHSMYGHGYVLLYVLAYYADGYPQFWTVLDTRETKVAWVNGRRQYKLGDTVLDASRVIQIDRDPSWRAHGTPALWAYAQLAYGLLAAGNQALSVQEGGTPLSVLKSTLPLDSDQAAELKQQWASGGTAGQPRILPPELDFVQPLSFSPAELALLDTQEFDAKAIAAAYGVPAVLLNMSLQGSLTYQNPAALGETWWRFELRTTAKRIADALSAQALPRGQWVNFKATDTILPLTELSDEDDPQLAAPVAPASPAQQPAPLVAVQ